MDDLTLHLNKVKFDKQLKKLNKKLKGKTIIIYGSGLLFQKVLKEYDLSALNIIGVSDRKYSLEQDGQEDLGFKIIPLEKIPEYNPDCVLIATLQFLSILDNFKNSRFKNSNILFLPLVDKPFWTLLKEIFYN